jgi:hypothetical protein
VLEQRLEHDSRQSKGVSDLFDFVEIRGRKNDSQQLRCARRRA